MPIQEINEPVAVILILEHGKARPFRIKWRERAYQVRAVLHSWYQKRGIGKEMHISFETTTNMTQPQANSPQAYGTRAKTKAAYRFNDDRSHTMDNLLRPIMNLSKTA